MRLFFILSLVLVSRCGSSNKGDDSSNPLPQMSERSSSPMVTESKAQKEECNYNPLLEKIDAQRKEIYYQNHASNRATDFRSELGRLKAQPKKGYMLLVEAKIDGKLQEIFVSGDENLGQDILKNFVDTESVSDASKALKKAISENQSFYFYITTVANMGQKTNCKLDNVNLAEYYRRGAAAPAECIVKEGHESFDIIKDALMNSGHFDVTKVFTDQGER